MSSGRACAECTTDEIWWRGCANVDVGGGGVSSRGKKLGGGWAKQRNYDKPSVSPDTLSQQADIGEGGTNSLLSRLAIDHAPLSRRSTVPTPNRVISEIGRLLRFSHICGRILGRRGGGGVRTLNVDLRWLTWLLLHLNSLFYPLVVRLQSHVQAPSPRSGCQSLILPLLTSYRSRSWKLKRDVLHEMAI